MSEEPAEYNKTKATRRIINFLWSRATDDQIKAIAAMLGTRTEAE